MLTCINGLEQGTVLLGVAPTDFFPEPICTEGRLHATKKVLEGLLAGARKVHRKIGEVDGVRPRLVAERAMVMAVVVIAWRRDDRPQDEVGGKMRVW